MAQQHFPETSPGPQNDEAAFQAFQEHRWDLDKDFLGGLVLALGGYHALARTASQADIIMHSRIFYYARIRGVTIPHAPYRAWLRRRLLSSSSSNRSRADQSSSSSSSSSSSPPLPRIWEWDLLTALCNHRDRLAGASQSPSPSPGAAAAAADLQARDAAAAAERDLWMRELLGAGSSGDDAAESTPAWMAAAPRGDLYVDPSDAAAGAEAGVGGQVPYPDQFAAIIKAVQSGERIEGIVEIPDVVVRNPTTTPFGKMARPRKPWETAQDVPGDSTTDGNGNGLQNSLDHSFPDQEDAVS